MKKIQVGKYSDGKEEFIIQRIVNGLVSIFTRTGVKFLNAKRNDSIEIGESSLKDLLKRGLENFSRVKERD